METAISVINVCVQSSCGREVPDNTVNNRHVLTCCLVDPAVCGRCKSAVCGRCDPECVTGVTQQCDRCDPAVCDRCGPAVCGRCDPAVCDRRLKGAFVRTTRALGHFRAD